MQAGMRHELRLLRPRRRSSVGGCQSSPLFILVATTLFTTLCLHLILYDEMNLQYQGRVERYLSRSIRFPSRSILAFDEFFKKPPSADEVREFFQFQEPSQKDIPVFQPLWTCNEVDRRGKLVYLHMHRSAGFSIRALLRAYANFCGAGIAFVSHCVDVGFTSMEGEQYWTNEGLSSPRAGRECWLSHVENRTGDEYPVDQSNAVSTELLMANQVDILGDHLPVGVLDRWKESNGTPSTDVRYLTFFRDPMEKYISSYIFARQTKNQSVSAVAQELFLEASTRLSNDKYFDKTSNHLISPDQKRWIDEERLEWTYERRANLTMKNLLDYNVVVGLVEDFPNSVRQVEHLIGGNGNLTQMFQFFSSTTKIDGINGGSITKSSQFTKSISSAIRSNATQRTVVEEYLKYEQRMYDYASKLHHVQCSLLPFNVAPTPLES